jgi:hypothetical protein
MGFLMLEDCCFCNVCFCVWLFLFLFSSFINSILIECFENNNDSMIFFFNSITHSRICIYITNRMEMEKFLSVN